uniref:Uncharacterized protein LOC108049759 n=1 Tax=Drosophila rhopaloa TaxID=1041015 RepID=A0A6P4F8F3_DRORH
MLIALLLIPIIAVLGDGGKCESKSLLMDLLEMVPRHQNSTLSKCEEQLMELRKAWQDQQSWALKALDASGEGFSNFMMGQSTWLGNRFTCRAVHEPVLQDMTNSNSRLLRDVSPIAFDYVVAYIESNSPWQLQVSIKKNPLLHIGLCLPRSCDIPEVEQLIRRSLVSGNSFRCWDMDAKLAYAKKPTLRPHFFESGAVQMLFLVVGGTLLLTVVASRGLGQHSRILGCFDLASNWELAWKPVNPSQENRTINGLRVFTAFSLIGVHVVWYKYFSVDHSLEMLGKVVSMTMRHTYWPSMVEIFFVVSGYLTVLNFLKDEQLQQEIASDGLCGNGRRYLGQFIHRYCRLAPLQFVVILAGVVMMEYQRQVSVLHITDPQDELCRRYSIRNLLFIQNLYPIRDMCGSWTWSLGCDMQFDLVMPNRWVRLGAVVLIGWLAKQVTMDRLPATSIIHTFMITLRVLVTALASHLIVCGTKPDTSDSYAPTRWLLAILQSEQVQRISRFTYAIYLLNPIVIIYFYHSFSNEVKPDNTMILLFTIACSAICYAMAIVVTLLFEIPYNRMTNLLIKSRSFKKKNL